MNPSDQGVQGQTDKNWSKQTRTLQTAIIDKELYAEGRYLVQDTRDSIVITRPIKANSNYEH